MNRLLDGFTIPEITVNRTSLPMARRYASILLCDSLLASTRSECARILRIPYDEEPEETESFLLIKKYFADFLPNSRLVRASFPDGTRKVVVECDKINSPYLNCLPSFECFSDHFHLLRGEEKKRAFLANIRKFITACKEFFRKERCMLDLVGFGNVIPHDGNVLILDFNRIFRVPDNYKEEIPVGFSGFPFYDAGLRFLHALEIRMLSHGAQLDLPLALKKIGRGARPGEEGLSFVEILKRRMQGSDPDDDAGSDDPVPSANDSEFYAVLFDHERVRRVDAVTGGERSTYNY